MRAAAVVYVKDLDRVAAFYAGVVGLTLDARENDHAVLRADEFQLILVGMPKGWLSTKVRVAALIPQLIGAILLFPAILRLTATLDQWRLRR